MASTANEPPATLPWPAQADGIADIGVFCVHGIGMQAEGETLLNVVNPLLEEFANEGAQVSYGETILKPRQQLDPGPARMSAIVTQRTEQRTVRASMLLAESWWAGVFDPPSYFRLLSWLLTYGTWITIRHAVFSLSTPIRYVERYYHRRGRQRPDELRAVDTIYAWLAGAVSVFLVAVPMQWLLLLVGVVAILPLRSARQLAKRIALMASAFLGDASVYTANVAIRQAILTRVRTDLEWLASRSKTVVVLAHSQGAAVMYDLLRSIADLGKLRLVTYGAGIRKLTELEEDAQSRPPVVLICGALWFIGALFMFIAWFAAVYEIKFVASGAMDPVGPLLEFYLILCLLFSVALYYAARNRDEEIDLQLGEDVPLLLRKNLQWVDIYASSDPVPSGPLLGGEGWRVVHPEFEGFCSREVVNWLSTIADHTGYWKAPNDFVPAVARAICAWAGLPVPPRLGTHRKWRMVFRRLAGLAIAAAAIAAFWRAGDPLRALLWMPAWNMVPFDPDSITARIVVRYGLRDIAVFFAGFALYVGLAILYSRLVLDPAWNAWERSVQNYRRGGEVVRNKLMAAVVAHFKRLRLLGPTLRFLVCVLAVAVPLWLLAGAISSGAYGPTIAAAITLAEWGRKVGGSILILVLCVHLLGTVGREGKERKRGGGGS